MIIREAHSYGIAEGGNCDDAVLYGKEKCDLFVVTSINGMEVYHTKIVNDKDDAEFYETYRSSRISKGADLKFELMDSDEGSLGIFGGSADDLIFEVTHSVEGFVDSMNSRKSGKHVFKNSFMTITLHWEDDYQIEIN